MYIWLWVIGTSAIVLPLAIAALRGWVPKGVRHRTTPWATQVRGVAMLVIWAGGLVHPLLRSSDLTEDDMYFLGSLVQPGLLMFGAGLMAGSQLGEWFYRRAVPAGTPEAARYGGEPVPDRRSAADRYTSSE
ncbi:hypothetical protein [Streptomyces cadmiisoli]|uniref:hypothetical protein n=1 Tax=Streptomyces cadmiisoli TaxID=2184053 RepID=UPI003D7260A1